MKFNPIQYVESDGLPVMEVGNWAQKKYKLVGKYCDIFSSGMRNKWNIIYLDLFSGPGFVKNRDSGQLIKNSALIAMSVPHQFDHYILNDYDSEYTDALRHRIEVVNPEVNFKIYNEDANGCIEKILKDRPSFNNSKGTLTFCFLDPYSLNLDFDTIKILSREHVDILVLHALQMDGRRNLKYYIEDNNERIASFTGNQDWKSKFTGNGYPKAGFMKFISDEFDNSISQLGYNLTDKEMIQNNTGAGIYYLAFYSKHERGMEFFNKIRGGINDQLELF